MVQDNMDFLDMECPFFGSDFDIDTVRLAVVWECKDGTIIPIEEMATKHIKNCIRLIEKSIKDGRNWRTEYLPTLKSELDNRMFFEAMRNMSDEDFNKIVHKDKK